MNNLFTIIGDPHVNPKNLDKSEVLFNLVEDLNYSTIWLGDMLNNKEIISGKCLNFIYAKFKNSKLQHYILIGNHDWFNLECEDHSLKILAELPNVKIIDSPQIIEGMNFIPYTHDKTKFSEALELFSNNLNQVLFLHQDIIGFDLGTGFIAEDGISLEILKSFSKIISGHFHKFQQKNNLTFLGTPFSQSFGESNQAKYIGLFSKEKNHLELIETNFAKHVTITVNCDESKVITGVLNSKDFNRVILIGTQENINKFDRGLSEYANIKWVEKASDSNIQDVQIDETVDNIVQFEKWASEIKKIDVDTTKLGIKILRSLC